MRRRAAALLLGTLLALMLAARLRPARESSAPDRPALPVRPPSEPLLAATHVPPRPVLPRRPLFIAGRVVRGEDGRGVEGATVARNLEGESTASGPDGAFELSVPSPGRYWVFAEDAAGTGAAEVILAEEDSPQIMLILERSVPIQVQVRDASGRPLAGAAVGLQVSGDTAAVRRYRADAHGAATFRSRVGFFEIWAEHPGHAPSSTLLHVGEGDAVVTIALELRDASPLDLRLLDAAGRPAVDVPLVLGPVHAREGRDASARVASAWQATTSSTGLARLGAVPEGEWVVTLENPRIELPFVAPPLGVPRRVELRLPPARTLRGRVVTRNGSPAMGLFVEAFAGAEALGGRSPQQAGARTDEVGRFELHGLSPATWRVGVAGDEPSALETVDLERSDAEITLTAKYPTIAGRVAGIPDDLPCSVHAALLDAEAGKGPHRSVPIERDGAFTLLHLEEPGARRLWVSCGTVLGRQAPVAASLAVVAWPGDGDVELSVARTAALDGTILFEGEGPRPATYSVSIAGVRQGFAGPEFEMRGLASGHFWVEATASGFTAAEEAVLLRPGERAHVSLVLSRPITLSGQVIAQDAAPIGGARIDVAPDGCHLATKAILPELRRTISGPDGRFSIDSMPPGCLTLSIHRDGYQAERLELTRADEDRPLVLTLRDDVSDARRRP